MAAVRCLASQRLARSMSNFPVTFDSEGDAITLDGPAGATIMLNFRLEAQFGDAFDRGCHGS